MKYKDSVSSITMKAFTIFSSNRNDFVHDIAYDFYGKRLATCSSDMRIQIFDQSKNIHRQWEPVAEIKAHTGSVNKLAWAHPEFGQVLASCSTDRVVYIYEEQIDIRTGTHSWKKMVGVDILCVNRSYMADGGVCSYIKNFTECPQSVSAYNLYPTDGLQRRFIMLNMQQLDE